MTAEANPENLVWVVLKSPHQLFFEELELLIYETFQFLQHNEILWNFI